MDTSPVSQTLSPVISQPEARAANRLASSYKNELASLLSAAKPHPSATLGTKIDVKA